MEPQVTKVQGWDISDNGEDVIAFGGPVRVNFGSEMVGVSDLVADVIREMGGTAFMRRALDIIAEQNNPALFALKDFDPHAKNPEVVKGIRLLSSMYAENRKQVFEHFGYPTERKFIE